MAKITRKQYEAQQARLNALKTQIEDVTANIIKAGEELDLWQHPAFSDMCNHLHDAKSEAENAMRSVEEDWTTRNWTFADWASYELAARNID